MVPKSNTLDIDWPTTLAESARAVDAGRREMHRRSSNYRSQPSIDPKRMQEWVPGVKWGAPALGYSFEESLKRREELLPIIAKWSPDALLHAGTPPLYFENNWGPTRPESVSEVDYLVHSPAWALGFQKPAREAGVVCHVKYPDHPTEKYQDIWDFIVQELKAAS
jgi:hypothetical protein